MRRIQDITQSEGALTMYPLLGFCICVCIAVASSVVVKAHGGSIVLISLMIGFCLSFFNHGSGLKRGIDFCAKTLLKIGVSFMGVRISFEHIQSLGYPVITLAITCVAISLLIGWFVAYKLGLPTHFSVLTAASVSICGASAALAAASVLPEYKEKQQQLLFSVVGATVLSTFAMLLYPAILHALNVDEEISGIFIGASIHDMAQVVGAGAVFSDTASNTAVLVKMVRIGCLFPVILIISYLFRNQTSSLGKRNKFSSIPPFLIAFCVIVLLNNTGNIPQTAVDKLSIASDWMLLTAVAAIGMKSSLRGLSDLGSIPLIVIVLQTLILASAVGCLIVFLGI